MSDKKRTKSPGGTVRVNGLKYNSSKGNLNESFEEHEWAQYTGS